MKEVLNYNIHEILKFQIVRDKRKDLMRDLNLEFSFFEVNYVDDPDIVLNIGKFTPSNTSCYLVDHKYHIKENYLYCKDGGGSAKWEVEIMGFEEGNTTINFDSSVFGLENLLFPDLLAQNIALKPIIEYKLGRKNYFLIHSAAISKDNQAYVLAGRGSAFKTTITMDLVRNGGYDFLGDERVIIYEDKVLSFPLHFLMYTYRSQYLPTESFRNMLDKIRFVKYLRNNSNYTNLDVPVINSSTLEAIFFIVRTNEPGVRITPITLEKAVDKLIANEKGEMLRNSSLALSDFGYHYLEYMLAYSYVFPESKVAKYWRNVREDVRKILDGVPTYEIEMQYKYNHEVFDAIRRFIMIAV